MQITSNFHVQDATLVGFGVRTLLLAKDFSGITAQRLAGLGGLVEGEDEMFSALDTLLTDPSGYGLFVMEADAFGGVSDGLRAFQLLGEVARRVPMILISREVETQVFPDGYEAPTILRAPLSSVSLRVGFEHALRGRQMLRLN